MIEQSPPSLWPVSDQSPTDCRRNAKGLPNVRWSVGDWSETGGRLVCYHTSNEKKKKNSYSAIKIDRQEVMPRGQALWDRGIMYRVKYSTIPSEAHRKNADNWQTRKVNNLCMKIINSRLPSNSRDRSICVISKSIRFLHDTERKYNDVVAAFLNGFSRI